jgi:p-hydroxybenzoate 3-monooxygenase
MVHDGIYLGFNGVAHNIDFAKLVGKRVYIYDQKEVVTDLIAHRLKQDGQILFEVAGTSVHDFSTDRPKIRVTHGGKAQQIDCDFIAGCDGFHGVCRPSLPEGSWRGYDRVYPYGWLGILSESPPPEQELIYSYHERGFALFSMRGPDLSRLYFQCAPDEEIDQWSDARIWEELRIRLGGVRPLQQGTIVQKGVTAMRSYVAEPMRVGRLFLAGDSAHIVPPTGAKGMNLAIADTVYLSRALERFYRSKNTDGLEAYSATCLRRVWKAQRFSYWMTQMFHRQRGGDYADFDMKRQLAELDYVSSSHAASVSLAENYTGLPID